MRFFLGLDFGQLNDFTALAVAERVMEIPQKPAALPWQPGHPLHDLAHTLVDQPRSPPIPKASYRLRHLQRYPLRTSYPSIVASVKTLVSRLELQDPELQEDLVLAVDHTGVGVAVHNMLQDAELPCLLYGVTIHGGSEVTQDGMRYSVPKRDLITLTQVLLQNERLKIAEALPEAKTLTKELLNYRLKIDPITAHDSYNAREGAHDDLVLAVALACWIGEETGGCEPRARWLR
jgi:hypothetical protein